MFCGEYTIKNEPIKAEENDLLPNIVIKCEKDCDLQSNEYDSYKSVITTICSESEYLADGNLPFESIIVKEEPRLNDCNQSENIVDALNWECYLCRFASIDTTDLRKHMKTHNNQKIDRKHLRKKNRRKVTHNAFSCEHCKKTFASHSGLYRHKWIHKAVELFICDYCDRKCLRKATLRQHMLIHSGVRRFECNECQRKFTDSSTLYKHKQTHSKDRPFACHLCDRRCSRKSTLERHIKTHTGEKSFTCDTCSKKFSRNSTLNHHKLIHSGVSPFPCDQCHRKYKTKSTLDYHLKTHSGLMPFRCEECNRNFMTKSNLKQHRKNNKRHRDAHHEDGDSRASSQGEGKRSDEHCVK